NDPLYPQQWYIPAVHADAVWDTVAGNDSTQIIAILDTGVDWLHPDLQNKIWVNPGEISGNGIDDDGNGKVDDIRGWDWINNDNNPTDDNSHGTHVAGIAAAEANNGIGISGVSQGAKIMSLKVFQSSGRGDAATISQGIIYAMNKGASVINMSFGSYFRSLTMENALVNAYASCVLVAAAGNDNLNLNDDIPIIHPTILYPAGLSYVIGVQATQNALNLNSANPYKVGTYLPDFTNFDDSGPVFSKFLELQNYEIQAPGANIISSIPNGNYRAFNGTSMATPIVSGVVAICKSINNTKSQEILWAKLIRNNEPNINVYNAIHATLNPQLAIVSSTIVDTIAGDDNDGRVDADETIEIWYKIRNTGSLTESAFVGIKFGEFEDTSTAQILTAQSFIGSVSTYATMTNELLPLKIHISPSVVNGRDIIFRTYVGYTNSPDTIFQDIVVSVENGQQLEGVMDSTFVLTADKLWFVNGSFRVGVNGTLTINPGTHLVIGDRVTIRGTLIANGTSDSLIVITSATPSTWYTPPVFKFESSNVVFNYVHFYNLNSPLGYPDDGGVGGATNCLFEETQFSIGNNMTSTFTNNMVRNSNVYQFWNNGPSISKYNVFYNNYLRDRNGLPQTCLYNTYYKNMGQSSVSFPSALLSASGVDTSLFKNNSFVNSIDYCNSFLTEGSAEYLNLGKQYWGSTNPLTIKIHIYDFYKNSSLPLAVYEPLLISPSDSCHGHVWKVLINGADAQDEFVEPVGVGPQRFDVYFNREMDTIFTPQLSFGVRSPYTQTTVADSGSWDVTHRIWTAYKTIQLYTGDGINRIRVAGAKEANGWQWEIPVEDMRFEFVIAAAGSASTNFIAQAGIGKVDLEWNNAGIEDLLGFNMYRFKNLTDTTYSDPVLINTTLITDTVYTDFAVIPNEHYWYYYKVVNTDFHESDSSNFVNAIPYNAPTGDANGDGLVNVLDITVIISYMLNQNPQPFLFDAADVNNDNAINILDVIGVVNLINGTKSSIPQLIGTHPLTAYIKMEGDQIELHHNGQIASMQFELLGENLE
ncbi:MAG: S8 family serine peptidase, partial [Bacteroidales bacterium]